MLNAMSLPLLYTFRRCPYAMRARWAIQAAGVAVAQHEVSLRAKPPAMLAVSPKGTVPVLVLPGGQVIDQFVGLENILQVLSLPALWSGLGRVVAFGSVDFFAPGVMLGSMANMTT